MFPFQLFQLTYFESQPPLCPPPPEYCHALLQQEYVQFRRKLALNVSMQQVERQMQAAGQQDEVAMQHLQQDSAL